MNTPTDHKMRDAYDSTSNPTVTSHAVSNSLSSPTTCEPASLSHNGNLANNDLVDGLVQALPQEMQDMILHEVLLTSLSPLGHVVNIDPSYKPPVAIQLSKKHRELHANEFYTNTTFGTNEYELKTCAKWLSSLTPEHLESVRTIRCADPSKWNIIDRNDMVDITHPKTSRTIHDAVAAVDMIYEYSQEMVPFGADPITLYHDVILVDLRFTQPDGSFITRWYRDGCLEEEE